VVLRKTFESTPQKDLFQTLLSIARNL